MGARGTAKQHSSITQLRTPAIKRHPAIVVGSAIVRTCYTRTGVLAKKCKHHMHRQKTLLCQHGCCLGSKRPLVPAAPSARISTLPIRHGAGGRVARVATQQPFGTAVLVEGLSGLRGAGCAKTLNLRGTLHATLGGDLCLWPSDEAPHDDLTVAQLAQAAKTAGVL